MAAVALMSWLRGEDPWKVVKVPASFVIGAEATRPPGFVPADVLLGLLMHLFFSVLLVKNASVLVRALASGAPGPPRDQPVV